MIIPPRPRQPIAASLLCASLLAMTSATSIASRRGFPLATRASAPGMTYTVHYVVPNATTSIDTGDGHPMDVPWEWTGRVIWANGRGRMDLIDGGYPGNFGFYIAKGDYVLFDSTDFVVVQPRMHRFFAVAPIDLLVRTLLATATPDTAGQFAGLTVSLDSLKGASAVADRPTKHYQVKTLYSHVRHEAGKAPEPYKTTVIMDYWLADAKDLPPNPFMRFAQTDFETVGAWSSSPPSFQDELLDKTAAIVGTLPHDRVMLKASYLELEVGQRTAVSGNSRTLRTEDRTINDPAVIEVSEISPATVDVAKLALPDDLDEIDLYRDDLRARFPTDPRLAVPWSTAKWRTVPGEK